MQTTQTPDIHILYRNWACNNSVYPLEVGKYIWDKNFFSHQHRAPIRKTPTVPLYHVLHNSFYLKITVKINRKQFNIKYTNFSI